MTKKYTVRGLVQGIGFRPFVAELCEKLNISGWVRNSGGIVTILASGAESDLNTLIAEIKGQIPTGGFISSIDEEVCDYNVENASFKIIESNEDETSTLPLIPADIATCEKCEKELFDPANRRFKHPFISCTICGPRYSIIKKLPYDRETITMGQFEMCPDCKREYNGAGNRRRYAQTIACPHCGPKLDETVENAVNCIKNGGIVAIKDIGGFHLACDPFNEAAVQSLRTLKHREEKAFAVMFESVAQIKKYAFVNAKEEELLKSPARPIVLVRRNGGGKLAPNVCLKSPDIGAMLPCNPLQILLVKECGPIVMTSGNGSGDVLEIDNDKMRVWMEKRFASDEMAGRKFLILSHDRPILRPLDDSVMKVVADRKMFLRRARGFVPNPIPVDLDGEIFAAGGDLKSTFCYVKNGLAYPSQYLGDLESISCQDFYVKEKAAMAEIFGFKPSVTVADMHPGYFSRKINESDIVIQHHKAHVASVIAEHKLSGPVLGFAFDGTGYGDDGTIWGSEIFTWDGKAMERVGHLKPVKLIGGDEGAKNCKIILEGFLHASMLGDPENMIDKAIEAGINTVISTSMGRLFDGVSCLLGICEYNAYEGQAPIELENVAAENDEVYPLRIEENGDTTGLFCQLQEAINKGVDKGSLALGFIYAVADFILLNAKKFGIHQIALSGGTFNNRILTERAIELLEKNGFEVFVNEELPPGDQNICLGQAFLSSKIQ